MFRIFWQLLLSFTLLWSNARAGQVVLTDSSPPKVIIGKKVHLLADKHQKLRSLDTVMSAPYRLMFTRSDKDIPNEGFTNSSYWIRFDLNNQAAANLPWLMEIGFGNYREIDFYFVSKTNGKIIHRKGGEAQTSHRADVAYHTYIFKIPPPSFSREMTVYIRLENTFGQALFPLYIWQQDAFTNAAQTSGLLWGLYYGILAIVLFYHLMLFLFTREKGYLLLSAYLVSYALYELSRGYCFGIRYLWGQNAWLSQHSLSTFFTLTNITFLLFYSFVLQIGKTAPHLQRILQVLISVCVLSWIVTLFGIPELSTNFVLVLSGLFTSAFLIFLGIYGMWKGQRAAVYYLAAAVFIFAGGIFHSLIRAGIIPETGALSHYTMNIGSVFEFIFLTVGLAQTTRHEKRERRLAQERQAKEMAESELRGQTEERKRVALELHDSVGSHLLGLRQLMSGLKAEYSSSDNFERMQKLVHDTYDEIRKISNNLLPDEFEKKGLSTASAELIERLNHTSDIRFYLLVSGKEKNLPLKAQFQVFLVLVELTNNILKHARATEASIRFFTKSKTEMLHISVIDNGIGGVGENGQGIGWAHMTQRLAQVGGELEVDYSEETGTALLIRVPYLHLQ